MDHLILGEVLASIGDSIGSGGRLRLETKVIVDCFHKRVSLAWVEAFVVVEL